ncbi:MAG: Ribose transport system ATP-binding protein [Cryobacterium sp.]|jgi:ribose transport system ATP-binding protein|nr:Ribose transport system ATP-binding protein [Cryobacterium sp.]
MTVIDDSLIVPALELRGISKSFAGVPAVRDVSFAIGVGQVVALAGENGAGKSTIKNMIGGILRPDSGTILVRGGEQAASVAGVRAQHVTTVHQEISLFADLTVAENIWINSLSGRAPFGVSLRKLAARSESVLERVGAHFSPLATLGDLSTGQTQLVEIAKALVSNPKVLVLDEPTASLTMTERHYVFNAVSSLRDEGVGILFISHFLEEIFQLSDRIVVLRDGGLVADLPRKELDRASLEALMVGRELAAGFPAISPPTDQIALSVSGLTDDTITDVSFELRRGEILGVSGLMGAGRTEIARAIFGLSEAHGDVAVYGVPLKPRSPQAAIAAGVAFVTEDRRDEGIFLERPIRETLSVVALDALGKPRWSGVIDREQERRKAVEQAQQMHVTARGGLEANGISLSGGNQQKVVIGKWLETAPRVLILDEPTRGIDIGAKAEIYRLLAELAREGLAILLISSEMEEILGMSHRVAVMARGRLLGILDRDDADQKKLIRLATGGEL